MKIITAVEKYDDIDLNGKVTCFLAGGITNCWDWQSEVINLLKEYEKTINLDDFIIFNPRRENFPINDPNASKEQIEWEFYALSKSNIFSMYFAGNTESTQPICFYELGKDLGLRYPDFQNVVITSEPTFLRDRDVREQVRLITNDGLCVGYNIHEHVLGILEKYSEFQKTQLSELFS